MNGLLSEAVVIMMVLPQLLLVAGERLLEKSRERPVFEVTTLSRLQFVCVVAAFSCLITGYVLRKKSFSWIGRVFLCGEIAVAWYIGLRGMGRAVARLVSGRS